MSDGADTLFARIGGRAGVEGLTDDFYGAVAADAFLRALYPADLRPGREKLALFLEQWLGGEQRYSERRGHPRLRRRHFPFVIGEAHADRWLAHMRAALEGRALAADDLDAIWSRMEPLARHMVNAGEDVPRDPLPEDAWLT